MAKNRSFPRRAVPIAASYPQCEGSPRGGSFYAQFSTQSIFPASEAEAGSKALKSTGAAQNVATFRCETAFSNGSR
jgi:hypothetical protein